jgi:U4/U6.U5 tri-snRNP-associated protein 3
MSESYYDDDRAYDPRNRSSNRNDRGVEDSSGRNTEYSRRQNRQQQQQPRNHDRRDRSRSRSPDHHHVAHVINNNTSSSRSNHQKGDLEAARRSRMARLRAENEEEERQFAALEENTGKPNEKSAKDSIVQVDDKELEGLDEEEQMRKLLGFTGSFGSTKGEKVEDNHKTSAKGAAAKNKARKYRQYMNRKVLPPIFTVWETPFSFFSHLCLHSFLLS